MSEMVRVLKPGGHIAIVDMVPPFIESRAEFDRLEILRDESHIRCFTAEELTDMAEKQGIIEIKTGNETVPINLADWMDLTDTSDKAQREIRDALLTDWSGGTSSGMDSYMDNGHIMFRRHWVYIVGKKQ